MDKILHMYSGGRDSLLSAYILKESRDPVYDVFLQFFDNGCIKNTQHAYSAFDIGNIKQKFFIKPIVSTAGIWRSLWRDCPNKTADEILNEYGKLSISQFHCITCHAAMYVAAAAICQNEHMKFVSMGTRRSQGFSVDNPKIVGKIKEFFKKYDIEVVLPVYNLDDDNKRKNMLMMRDAPTKVLEPQCMIGFPLEKELTEDEIEAACKFWDYSLLASMELLVWPTMDILLSQSNEMTAMKGE